MRLTYLTWSAFHIRTDGGLSLLFDPWVEGDGGRVVASPVSPADLGPVDYVVITHTTEDHFGQTIEFLERDKSTTLLCGRDVEIYAEHLGIPLARIINFSPGNSLTIGDVWIKAVLAHHPSIRKFSGESYLTGLPFSYFVREDSGTTVFNGGDTSLHSELKLFGDLYRPDVAILGIGGRRGVQPTGGIFGPVLPIDEAVHAARMLGVKYALPSHYLADTGVETEWPAAFDGTGINALYMERGQAVTFIGGKLADRGA